MTKMLTQREIRAMVATIRSGGNLSAGRDDSILRLHLAIVRYANGLGSGDVEAEYAEVVKAMTVKA